MDDSIRIFHGILSIAGIPFFSKDRRKSKLSFLFQVFNTFVGLLVIIFTTMFVINNTKDTLVLIEGTCIYTTGAISFMSLAVALVFREEYCYFVNEIGFKDIILEMSFIEYVLEHAQTKKMVELKDLVVSSHKKLHKLIKRLLKFYLVVVWSCWLLYFLGAIYQMCVRKDKSQRFVAFDMDFPWKLDNYYVYLMTFLFNAYAGFLCSIMYPGFQATIIFLLGQLIRQLRILTFILQNLSELVSEMVTEKDERWHYYCSVLFQQTAEHYIKIKRFSNRLNKICQPVYLTLILIATMLVCVCSVKIAISNKLSADLIKHYIHEVGFILMILMFCSTGQQLENQCEKLEEAVTANWCVFSRAQKNNMKIFQMAAGQRMPIYIFGSVKLNLPTFTWFIKTGVSFFTLVMSLLEE